MERKYPNLCKPIRIGNVWYRNRMFSTPMGGTDIELDGCIGPKSQAFYEYRAKGFFAPGLSDEKYARQCIHHLLLCHGEAVKLFRSRQLPGQIGVVVDVWKHYPARPEKAEDIASAVHNNEIEGYGMFLHPLFCGGYSEELTAYMEETGFTPKSEPGDMETICQRLDFYGLNFYNGLYDHADEQRAATEGGNFQNRPELHLEAVYDVLHMLVE